jgi:hypothetical protein
MVWWDRCPSSRRGRADTGRPRAAGPAGWMDGEAARVPLWESEQRAFGEAR